MQDQATRDAALTAMAQYPSMTALPFTLASIDVAARPAPAWLATAAHRARRLARFTRTAARHPITTGRTAVRAAKLLPTVRHAIPRWIWPILGLAAAVKAFVWPDMGVDEALFLLAAALIALTRPGLLTVLWREAQAGKAAWCQCEPCSARWARRQARRAAVRRALSITARKAEAR